MAWGKLDDKYHSHRKTRVSSLHALAAIGLHALGISYSADHETDGRLDGEWIEDKLFRLKDKDREAVLKVATDKRLLDAEGDDLMVHDYTDYNPSKASLEERREKDRERKRGGVPQDSMRNPKGDASDSVTSPPGPSRAPRRAPGRVGSGGAKETTQLVDQILAKLDETERWEINQVDDRMRVERTVLDSPAADHLAAADAALAKAADPAWRSGPGKTFDYAVRQQLDYSASKPESKPKRDRSKYDKGLESRRPAA